MSLCIFCVLLPKTVYTTTDQLHKLGCRIHNILSTINYVLYVQGLVSRVEKNLSDHTEFVKAKEEFDTWLQRAHGTVQDCIGVGDEDSTRDKLETVRVSMGNLVLFHPF